MHGGGNMPWWGFKANSFTAARLRPTWPPSDVHANALVEEAEQHANKSINVWKIVGMPVAPGLKDDGEREECSPPHWVLDFDRICRCHLICLECVDRLRKLRCDIFKATIELCLIHGWNTLCGEGWIYWPATRRVDGIKIARLLLWGNRRLWQIPLELRDAKPQIKGPKTTWFFEPQN